MDREVLLKRLGLSSEELQEFLRKFSDFQRGLDPAQRRLLRRSLPSLERARASLGPTIEDMSELFGEEPDSDGLLFGCFMGGDDGGN